MSKSLQGQRVLVTGGAGFIGSHVVDALLRSGARVRVLDNLVSGRLENLAHCRNHIEFVEGDLRDPEACRTACQDASVVFHHAALGSVPRSLADPATTVDVNVAGTANLFGAAREAGTRRVVYASSSSVYGDSAVSPKREGQEGRLISPYALSKRMNEELADVFTRCYGMEFVGLRYFNVYGPRQDPDGPYAAVIPRFFAACLAGEAPVIYGDGRQSRDFTFVADAVQANLLAASAETSACGAAFNIGGGAETDVETLARLVREAAGRGREPRHEAPRPGDVAHSLADLSLSGSRLGYAPRTSLAEGLHETRDYYASVVAPASGRAARVPSGVDGV